MSSLQLVSPGKPTPAGLAIVKNSIEIHSKIENRAIKDPAVPALVTRKYVDNFPQWEFHQQAAGPMLTDSEGRGQIHPITPVGLRRAQVASMDWRTVENDGTCPAAPGLCRKLLPLGTPPLDASACPAILEGRVATLLAK